MPFCSNCGAQVTGPFCGSCGTPIEGGSAEAGGAQPGPAPPAVPAPAAPAKGKRGPLPYILLGCGAIAVLAVLGLVMAGWFVKGKLEQAGLSSEEAKSNPAMAAAKMMVAVNPDLELVSADEARGTITVRQKSTGKQVTVNLEDARQGRIVFQEEGKGEVELKAQGGQITVQTPEGTARIGAAEAPDWLPAYSGAQGQGMYSSSTAEGERGTYTFKTADSVDQVVSFFERELPGKGFNVKRTQSHTVGAMRMEMLTATGGGRTVRISVMRAENETVVSVSWQ
jgi:hypothetical protein